MQSGAGNGPAMAMAPKGSAEPDFANLRRGKLTQVDVLNSAPPWRKLRPVPIVCTLLGAAFYTCYMVPGLAQFGSARWQIQVETGVLEPRAGGPFAEVSGSLALLLSLAYVSLTFVGLGRMAQRSLPVQTFIFECMAVHNATQCCYNLYCFVMLVLEGHAQGFQIWGNVPDTTARSHRLGWLMWLQYHCRQLQLVETGFMVLQKKFQGVSFLHVYLRVLNLWGWFIACHCGCGAEAFVPALVSSGCQTVVYGLYSSFSCTSSSPSRSDSRVSRATWVFRLQIAQYILCAGHSLAAAIWGHFPAKLAALHLFVIGNGLILYTEWHSEPLAASRLSRQSSDESPRRVTFSFDSCGWLFVYHFGVGFWLSDNLGLLRKPDEPHSMPEEVAFSGSSGGSLIACVLACGNNVRDVFDFIVEQQPLCKRNPVEMFPAVERALRKFQFEGAYLRLIGRMRVLLTRVMQHPPFVQGEVIDKFPDNETVIQTLCASCHVPLFAGLFPRRIFGRYYYDGLVWPDRLLVPWRGAPGDHVVRVSACAHPLADVKIDRVPYWWAVLPPEPRVLRGVFWCGYRDAARWFSTKPQDSPESCCRKNPQASAASTARWRAAQALLKKDPRAELPEKDPVTGESVSELIREAEALAAQATHFVSVAVTALVALLLALVAVPTSW